MNSSLVQIQDEKTEPQIIEHQTQIQNQIEAHDNSFEVLQSSLSTSLSSQSSLTSQANMSAQGNTVHLETVYSSPFESTRQTEKSVQNAIQVQNYAYDTREEIIQSTESQEEQFRSRFELSKKRVYFTPEQRSQLENLYKSQQYPTRDDKNRLARALNIAENKIQVWFQNRRARDRRPRCSRRKLRHPHGHWLPGLALGGSSHYPGANSLFQFHSNQNYPGIHNHWKNNGLPNHLSPYCSNIFPRQWAQQHHHPMVENSNVRLEKQFCHDRNQGSKFATACPTSYNVMANWGSNLATAGAPLSQPLVQSASSTGSEISYDSTPPPNHIQKTEPQEEHLQLSTEN